MSNTSRQPASRHRVVIVGGGFGGLYAAKALARRDADVTLIDRRNYHLFQPLLYQVATGGLSPGDISATLRSELKSAKNVRVLLGNVDDILPDKRAVTVRDITANRTLQVPYDSLILATGATHTYFGNDQWVDTAPGLKTVEDALEIRRRIFSALEQAEVESDPAVRAELLTFVIVGAGPTGVELAGALAELSRRTLRGEFRSIDPEKARIALVEGLARVLPMFPEDLSKNARRVLEDLGVEVRTGALVTGIDGATVQLKSGDTVETLRARTVLWTAGVQASSLGGILVERTGAESDRAGRIVVDGNLNPTGYPDIYVIGDLAYYEQDGRPLPGVAQVAIQQGRHAARVIRARLRGAASPAFRYRDYGNLAVIGRNVAVADFGFVRITGFLAWLAWALVHIAKLIGFQNRMLVMVQWSFDYLTRNKGARLITETSHFVRRKNEGEDT